MDGWHGVRWRLGLLQTRLPGDAGARDIERVRCRMPFRAPPAAPADEFNTDIFNILVQPTAKFYPDTPRALRRESLSTLVTGSVARTAHW